MSKTTDHYGDGCRAGHFLAQAWLNNPKRGDSSAGGTLQHVMLDIARKLKDASGKKEEARASGEIVGFCYAIECPEHAAKCLEADARRQ
ncbi:MAG: hypothetical protein Q8J72_12730 [Rhodocyclaceae bacterium]|nr:hypothetical protein [Rhodocyclaceae bacterium]